MKIPPFFLRTLSCFVRLLCLPAIAGLVPLANAHPVGRSVAGDRLLLPDSLAPVAATALTATRRQAILNRTVLTDAETAVPITFEVGLSMRDLPGLRALQAAGEKVTPATLEARYLPVAADYDAVANWLTSEGFTIVKKDGHRLAIFARGTVAQVQASFRTPFAQVVFGGVNYLSAVGVPSMPASLSAVIGVVGLQPFLAYHLQSRLSVRGQTPVPATNNQPPYLVSEILGAYRATSTSLTGSEETIGIIIDAVPLDADLTTFWTVNNVNQTLSRIASEYVGATGTLDERDGEESIDVEWSSSVAPQANVKIFNSGTLAFADADAAYSQVATELQKGELPTLHQLSMSYGGDEEDFPPTL